MEAREREGIGYSRGRRKRRKKKEEDWLVLPNPRDAQNNMHRSSRYEFFDQNYLHFCSHRFPVT
jgi:hypothetical protein